MPPSQDHDTPEPGNYPQSSQPGQASRTRLHPTPATLTSDLLPSPSPTGRDRPCPELWTTLGEKHTNTNTLSHKHKQTHTDTPPRAKPKPKPPHPEINTPPPPPAATPRAARAQPTSATHSQTQPPVRLRTSSQTQPAPGVGESDPLALNQFGFSAGQFKRLMREAEVEGMPKEGSGGDPNLAAEERKDKMGF